MQADTEFHLALAEASGNRLFREAVEKIRLELNDAMSALPESRVWHERSAREHEAILNAVREQDRDARRAGDGDAHRAHRRRASRPCSAPSERAVDRGCGVGYAMDSLQVL